MSQPPDTKPEMAETTAAKETVPAPALVNVPESPLIVKPRV